MAKKPAAKTETKPETKPVLSLDAPYAGLVETLAVSCRALAAATVAFEGATEGEAKTAAEAGLNKAKADAAEAEQTLNAHLIQLVQAQVDAAQAEADRQLAARRADLQAALDEVATQIAEAQARSKAAGEAAPSPELRGKQGHVIIDETPSEAETLTVTVTGPAKGRWRGGRHWTAEPKTLALTQDEIDVLLTDPTISVVSA